MKFGVFLCSVSLVSGLSPAFSNALLANSLGLTGLQGALLASSFGGGNVFDTYLASQTLSDPSASNLFLLSALGGNGGLGGGSLNTYFAANAFKNDPTGFFLADALSGGRGNTLESAALADAFGGGFQGALAANALISGPNNYNTPYVNAGFNGGAYWSPNYNTPYVNAGFNGGAYWSPYWSTNAGFNGGAYWTTPYTPIVSTPPPVITPIISTPPPVITPIVDTTFSASAGVTGCFDAWGVWQPICTTGFVAANTGCWVNGIWQATCFV